MAQTMFHTRLITLHGERVGSGPLVVFLHGITANWAVWHPIVRELKSEWTCVAVSQRGHGLSARPRTGYGADSYAEDVCALIESLDAGPAIVVGHSLGARNAIVAAARRPDLICGVLSIDFVPGIERTALDALASRVSSGSRSFASLDDVVAYLRGRYPGLPEDAIRRRAEHGYQCVGGAFMPLAGPDAMTETALGLYAPYADEYGSVNVPVIAVRGADSRLVSSRAFELARELRPDVRHVVVEGADHYVPEESPTAIAELVGELAR